MVGWLLEVVGIVGTIGIEQRQCGKETTTFRITPVREEDPRGQVTQDSISIRDTRDGSGFGAGGLAPTMVVVVKAGEESVVGGWWWGKVYLRWPAGQVRREDDEKSVLQARPDGSWREGMRRGTSQAYWGN